jgi:hypothetical protein
MKLPERGVSGTPVCRRGGWGWVGAAIGSGIAAGLGFRGILFLVSWGDEGRYREGVTAWRGEDVSCVTGGDEGKFHRHEE